MSGWIIFGLFIAAVAVLLWFIWFSGYCPPDEGP